MDMLPAGLAVVLFFLVYFFPYIVASNRHHRQAEAIFVLTLLLGWTLVGWVAALCWALTAPPVPTAVASSPPPSSP